MKKHFTCVACGHVHASRIAVAGVRINGKWFYLCESGRACQKRIVKRDIDALQVLARRNAEARASSEAAAEWEHREHEGGGS